MRKIVLAGTPLPSSPSPIVQLFGNRNKGTVSFDTFKQSVLRNAASGLRQLNPDDDASFAGAIRLVTNFSLVDLNQKEVAALLCVSPMSLQRWAKGVSLPHVLPRRAFFEAIVQIVEAAAYTDGDGTADPIDDDRLRELIDSSPAAEVCL